MHTGGERDTHRYAKIQNTGDMEKKDKVRYKS
jgi:hypothetical protein